MVKAVRIHAYGGPDELRIDDIPKPDAGEGQVLVRVKAAGLNPVDWKIRSGALAEHMPLELPATLGGDIAGTVEAVGAGVENFSVGDEVFGFTDTVTGGYAEYVAVSADRLAQKPPGLDFPIAAAIPIAGLTAYQCVCDHGKVKAGDRVLVHGSAGGVGSLVAQFAKRQGAFVYGTSSKENFHFLDRIGVDAKIDYQSQRFEEVAKDLDVVFDLVGGETGRRSWSCLKPGGLIVSTVGEPDSGAADAEGKRAASMRMQVDPAELLEIAGLVSDGTVVIAIEGEPRLDEAAEAHRQSEAGHVRGKIVFRVA